MKKIIAMTLCATMALSLAACAKKEEAPKAPEKEPTSQTTQLANPFRDFDTLKEAEEAVGFSLEVPATIPNWVSETAFRTMNNEMLEVIYNGKDDQFRIRKAAGSDDISGIQTAYSETEEVPVGERTVTCKGENGLVYVAVWQDGDYTYAMSFDNGMEQASVIAMVETIR